MAPSEFGTGKSLMVLAIVLGCFAVLWPKIFYPMMQTAFAMTSPSVDADGRFRDPDRPPHMHPSSVNSRGRGPSPEDIHDKFMMREGRPFPHPQARQPAKSQPKSGGAMSIIMPIYTVGIVVFFLYTVLRLLFKKDKEEDKKPLIKDFHMDPEYHNFICKPNEGAKKSKKEKPVEKKKSNIIDTSIPEDEAEMDQRDYEIYKLRKKLEETEQAMERIIQHMGVVNACLSEKAKVEEVVPPESSEVRQRIKGKKNKSGRGNKSKKASKTTKECHIDNNPEAEEVCHGVQTLEQDLAELINLCNITDESLKKHADVCVANDGEIHYSSSDVDDCNDEMCYNEDGCCKNTACT